MIFNRIPVALGPFTKVTGPTVSYQYDEKQILVLTGVTLPEYYEVDICNEGDARTVTMVGTADGVLIPNAFLRTGRKVKAYVVLQGQDPGAVETRYEITLPVYVRPAREDIDPTSAEQQQIDELVAALNSGVNRAETAATEAEEASGHYPTIVDGYWFLWDADAGEYVPTGIKAEGTDGVSPTVTVSEITGGHRITITDVNGSRTVDVMDGEDGEDGKDGKDGSDGYSPTITVTDITGGHRVTVTDANGTRTFDVIDGTDGKDGKDGTDGDDGYSPVVTITNITGGHRVTITDADHPQGQSFDVMDGEVSEADLEAVANSKAPVIINTASGDIATFADGADDMPIKSLVASIEPVQDLHGYENPWPAGGGKNLLDDTLKAIDGNQIYLGTTSVSVSSAVSASLEAGTYTLSVETSDGTPTNLYIAYFGESTVSFSASNVKSLTFTLTEDSDIRVWAYKSDYSSIGIGAITHAQIETGSSVTAYVPYSNICPISGHTKCDLTRAGKNLVNDTLKAIDGNQIFIGTTSTSTTEAVSAFLKAGTYTFSVDTSDGTDSNLYVAYTGDSSYSFAAAGTKKLTFTLQEDSMVRVWAYKSGYSSIGVNAITHAQIEIGQTVTTYDAYKPIQTISVNWQSEAGTVYGGSLTVNDDGSADLLVTRAIIDMGDMAWTYDSTYDFFASLSLLTLRKLGIDFICSCYRNGGARADNQMGTADNNSIYSNSITGGWISVKDTDYTDATAFKTAVTGQKICYLLATPQSYHLDNIDQLTTILGTNNIWASTGDVSVEYPADTGIVITEQSNAIDAKQDATSYVTLSGTIVTQTGADNTMYLCGELAELTFTAPATGQTAIRFSSGTTPTVATFTGVTWLNGFDPTAIEASKTYEVNILYGVGVASWT